MINQKTLIAFLWTWVDSHGFRFATPRSTTLLRLSRRLPTAIQSGSSDDNMQFYDDFGDSLIGNSAPANSGDFMDSLQSKMTQTRKIEADNEAKMTRNWRTGNWSVRGFALSKTKLTSSEDKQGDLVHISAVAAPVSASVVDPLLTNDGSLPEYRNVVVGRTDGSVFLVRLGKEYLTKFASKPEIIENINSDVLTFRVEEKWHEQDQIKQEDQNDLQPFEILLDFQSSISNEEYHAIVYHDISKDDNNGYICAASGESGDINMWILPSTVQNQAEKPQSVILSGGHGMRVVSLKTAVLMSENYEEHHILVSASIDGTLSFWDLSKRGERLFSCQCMKEGVQLTCADISNPSLQQNYAFSDKPERISNDMLFIGTSDGYVMGFDLQKVLSNGECRECDISFRAHGTDSGKGEGITSIKCGGNGSMKSSGAGKSNISSSILLTGGEDGSVKQWEIMAQESVNGFRMEHWPRLASQRMKGRAHVFSPGHDGKVTALSQQSNFDSSTFLSCGEDGSVLVWDAASGDLLYSMDGFTRNISSLACLGRDLLVTDGMENLVCVHDFSVDEDEASNGYEMDW